jgi:hypothetical protein
MVYALADRGARLLIEPQLLTQEIVRDTVATIDDALAIIKRGITVPA